MTRNPTLVAVDLEVILEETLGVTPGATLVILTSLAVWPMIRARAQIACDRFLQMHREDWAVQGGRTGSDTEPA